MKKFLPVIVFVILAIGAYEYGLNRMVPNPDPNHTHADFAVWIGGERVDFAQEKYMTEELTANQLQALSNSTATGSTQKVLKQYLHLHGMNGYVIHRHKPGLTLEDFFDSLSSDSNPIQFHRNVSVGINYFTFCICTQPTAFECPCAPVSVRLFVNGEEVIDGPGYVFHDGDRLLITDAVDQTEVVNELDLLTDEACMLSKTCPGRGRPPVENCISDPMIPCIAP
jgi:hypothetical protein